MLKKCSSKKRTKLHVCMHACSVASVASDSLRPCGLQPTGSSVRGDSPAKNTGVGCHASSRGSSRCRDQTHVSYVSCIAGRFFTVRATWEATPPLLPEFLFKIPSHKRQSLTNLASQSSSWVSFPCYSKRISSWTLSVFLVIFGWRTSKFLSHETTTAQLERLYLNPPQHLLWFSLFSK